MKTFVLGDPHGAYKALLQCFERSKFNYEEDELIVLGDVCDGWTQIKECVDELLKIKNLIYILGNHDYWFYDWIKHDDRELAWISQGGWNTLKSYEFKKPPEEHIKLLENSNIYVEDDERSMVFCHGGFNPSIPIENQRPHDILWDRDLIRFAKKIESRERCRAYDTKTSFSKPTITKYKEIFVGHTTTAALTKDKGPAHYCNVWDLDTGAGWGGCLTMMDIDSKEYWQSDPTSDLYKDEKGRMDINLEDKDVQLWLDGK